MLKPIRRVPFAHQEYIPGIVLRPCVFTMVKAEKTEELVLPDRKAHDASELVHALNRLWTVSKERFGVECAVIVKPINTAVHIIGPGQRLHQNHGAITPAKFCRKAIGYHLEFFDSGYGRALPVLIFRRIVVVDPVDLKRCSSCARAVEVY